MHVGLNLVFLVPGETGGMEVAARELLPALVQGAPAGTRFTAFVNREAAAAHSGPWFDLMPAVRVPVRASRRLEWVAGEQLLLPRLAARAGVDVLHSLASTAPARGPFRRVVTVHDLIYRLLPEAHFGVRAYAMRLLVPLAARRSDRVVAVSHATARDIERFGLARPDRIDVVPNGPGAVRAAAPTNARALRARLGLGDRHVLLTLSAKRPHKNLARLVAAHARLPAPRPVLVLPGYPTPHEEQLRREAAILGTADEVRLLPWVSAADLEGLYALAAAFVYPSLYEGFGLPVLEAMRRGVPVACSDRSSLPEVAGDAALLFDPDDVGSIAAALGILLSEPARVEALREAGRRQAARFSWEATARGTLASYARALR